MSVDLKKTTNFMVSNRNLLRELLNNYHPIYNEEKLYKKEMLNFLNNHQDCFERTCKKGHFTASAWLLNNNKTKVLLLHHRKLDQWFQLGGHSDGNPDFLAVAIKECQEESGIENIIPIQKSIFDLDIHTIPKFKNEEQHLHYDVRFLLKTDGNQKLKPNKESKDLKWFGNEESKLPTKTNSILRMVNKWLDRVV